MMTREQFHAGPLKWWADGALQYLEGSGWRDWKNIVCPNIESNIILRRRPEKKLRAWKWQEVPPLAWIAQRAGGLDEVMGLPVVVEPNDRTETSARSRKK